MIQSENKFREKLFRKFVFGKELPMFIGREKELQAVQAEISQWNRKSAILLYGKRRVGKSTLIREAAKSFEGVVIHHLCVK